MSDGTPGDEYEPDEDVEATLAWATVGLVIVFLGLMWVYSP